MVLVILTSNVLMLNNFILEDSDFDLQSQDSAIDSRSGSSRFEVPGKVSLIKVCFKLASSTSCMAFPSRN